MEDQGFFLLKDLLILICRKYAAPREALLLSNSCRVLRRECFSEKSRLNVIFKIAFKDWSECPYCDEIVKRKKMKNHWKYKCQKASGIWGCKKGFYCATCRVPQKIPWRMRAAHGPGRCRLKPYKSLFRCSTCKRCRDLVIDSFFCGKSCKAMYDAKTMNADVAFYFGPGNFIVACEEVKDCVCSWCAYSICSTRAKNDVHLSFYHKFLPALPCNKCNKCFYCSAICREKHWMWHQYECLEY